MITIYRNGPRQVQPIKGVTLPGGRTIAQYVSSVDQANAWIAKQRNPRLYTF